MSLVYFRVTFSTPKAGQENLPCAMKCCGYHSLYETVPKSLCEVSYANKVLSQQAVGTVIPYLEKVCLRSNLFVGCVRRHQAIRGNPGTFFPLE